MNPTVIRRFPLIARPRPVCTPLPYRVADLCERAIRARDTGDVTEATAVFNLAALLASDCGLPDLARSWCHRLARAALGNDHDPRHGLEPIVNLARLHIRSGDGAAAWTLLETLLRAVDTRTDTIIDGLTIPASRFTDTASTHVSVRSWLWKVLLGTGAHALAVTGRWEEASRRLTRYRGVGNRMLDGRQITIIAHAQAGRHDQARAMLEATHPGATWENAVTACLSLLVTIDTAQTGHVDLTRVDLPPYFDLAPAADGLLVFHTRLRLSWLDALGTNHPAAEPLAAALIRDAVRDGYAARDVLAHPGGRRVATRDQAHDLAAFVAACGLDRGTIPDTQLTRLATALGTAETVFGNVR